jgi:hypothetical protein
MAGEPGIRLGAEVARNRDSSRLAATKIGASGKTRENTANKHMLPNTFRASPTHFAYEFLVSSFFESRGSPRSLNGTRSQMTAP